MKNYNQKLVFNENELLKYLIDYDYISEKYGIDKNDDHYVECALHESTCQSPDVVKRDYSSIYDNIRLVYGDDKKANRMIMIYKIVKEEVINKFLNIPGLERLYDEHFFEFEWDMHSRLDFDNHNISFYRDHFVHQVRNLFEINRLIDDDEFGREFFDEFLNGNNKISAYVKQEAKALTVTKSSSFVYNFETWVHPLKCSLDEKQLETEYYAMYIMKASAALCSLFHDIGYPILHFTKLHKRISGFMPSMYMFLGDDNKNFEHIFAILCGSLLFRIVPKDELKSAICDDNNHGAVSATAFLLTFYENGIIRSLSADKRAALEIAAVAIYNHTLKYALIDGNNGKIYHSPKYKLNPLSYLLRVCDDIQEWERTYFEINREPDIIMCEKCGTPLIRRKTKQNFFRDTYDYKCLCTSANKSKYINIKDYTRREIIDIINCEEIRINFYLLEEGDGIKNEYMEINFDYDLAKLLKMCMISPQYSKYRINELKKTRKILMAQRLGGCRAAELLFTLSPNPFILKAEIIGAAIEAVKRDVRDDYINCKKNIGPNPKNVFDAAYDALQESTLKFKGSDQNDDIIEIIEEFQENSKKLKRVGHFAKKLNKAVTNPLKNIKTICDKIIDADTKKCFDKIEVQFTHFKEKVTDIDVIGASNPYDTSLSDLRDEIIKCNNKIGEKSKQFQNIWDIIDTACRNADSMILSRFNSIYTARNELNDFRTQSMLFYLRLYMVSQFFKNMNSRTETYYCWNNKRDIINMKKVSVKYFTEKLRETAWQITGETYDKYGIGVFIDDAVKQYSKLFDEKKSCPHALVSKDYYEQFKTEDKVYRNVARYCSTKNAINISNIHKLDFYSDLHFYITISDTIRHSKKFLDYYTLKERAF